MRFLALLTALGGLLVLSLLILTFPAKEITNQNELQTLEPNQKVVLTGTVIKEKITASVTYLTLENNITLKLEGQKNPSYLSKNITVEGLLERFNKREQINILRINFS